jgi:hypothetical protein
MIGGPGDGSGKHVLLQYVQPTYHFRPSLSAVQAPLRATPDSWSPFATNVSERLHPPFGALYPLDYQVAYFRRDGESRIIAAADISGSELASQAGARLMTSALFLTRDPDDMRVYRDSIAGRNKVFDIRAPAESTIVSIEALTAGVGAARVRFASGPPPMRDQRISASDVLLFDVSGGNEPTLEGAAYRALPRSTVQRTLPVGLFWELYGLEAGDTTSYTLSLTEGARSVLTGFGRILGVVGGEQNTTVQWSEVARAAEAIAPRSVSLSLSTLSVGEYSLRLHIAVPGQDTVTVVRQINVVR